MVWSYISKLKTNTVIIKTSNSIQAYGNQFAFCVILLQHLLCMMMYNSVYIISYSCA